MDKKILLLMVGIVFALAGALEQNVLWLEAFVLCAGVFSFLTFREYKEVYSGWDIANKITYGTASVLSVVAFLTPVIAYSTTALS